MLEPAGAGVQNLLSQEKALERSWESKPQTVRNLGRIQSTRNHLDLSKKHAPAGAPLFPLCLWLRNGLGLDTEPSLTFSKQGSEFSAPEPM